MDYELEGHTVEIYGKHVGVMSLHNYQTSCVLQYSFSTQSTGYLANPQKLDGRSNDNSICSVIRAHQRFKHLRTQKALP